MAQPIRSCPHCGGCTNRGHCAMPSWHQARAKNQRERVTDRGRNEQRPPTLAIGFQSWGDSLNIRGLGRECGFGAVVLLGKFSSSLTNPGAVFMCLAAALHTLHAAWAFALDDLLKLIPVELAKVIVAAFFIPLQVWVFKVQSQCLCLRNNHVDEALTQIVIGEALDIPFHGLLGVRGICIRWAEHLQCRAVETVNGFLCHLLLCLGAVCQRSEEHTSELQSRGHLVCRLLLEKKKQSNALAYK